MATSSAEFNIRSNEMVATFSFPPNKPAEPQRPLQRLPDRLTRDEAFLIAVNIAKLPSVPRGR